MSNDPKISVVIPYYNNSDTIIRAINSVLNQTLKVHEIIVVDDFSLDKDKLKNELEKVNYPFIKLIEHSENKNGSAARNTGINNSGGDFIALLDADDEWLPFHIENSYNELIKNDIYNTLIYCQERVITLMYKDLIMPSFGIDPNQNVTEYLFVKNGFMQTSSFFAHKSCFVNIPFNEKLIRHQDYDLLLEFQRKNVNFRMSDHVGVVLHWENVNQENKGATITYALDWLQSQKQQFTSKAYTYFVYKKAVIPSLTKGDYKLAFKYILKCNFFLLSLKEFIFLMSYILFQKNIFSKI